MKTMAKISRQSFCVFFIAILVLGCSKENVLVEEPIKGAFLKFETASKKNNENAVLYSEWVPSKFPDYSLHGLEFFELPLIEKSLLDTEKDLIMVYGKRNSVFPLPVTISTFSESYMVIFTSIDKGTITRLNVASTHWESEPLEDIYFGPTMNSKFRVVIVPGEKLLSLKSNISPDFEKMTYEEIANHFNLSS